MTETKREQRAAAIERLRELDYPVSMDMVSAIIGKQLWSTRIAIDALIDILTDDDAPKGNAEDILRKAASCTGEYSGPIEALRRLTDTTTIYYALEALADMVQRDYVPLPMYRKACNERDELEKETSELNKAIAGMVTDEDLQGELNDADKAIKSLNFEIEKLAKERDELCGSLDTEKAIVEAYKAGNTELRRIIDELTQPPTYGVDNGPQPDTIKSPAHYTQGGVECKDAIKAALTADEWRGWLKGNAIKYVWRERLKGGTQDLGKAHEMLGWLVDNHAGERMTDAPLIVGECAACSSLIFAGDNYCAKCGAKAAIVRTVDNCGGGCDD